MDSSIITSISAGVSGMSAPVSPAGEKSVILGYKEDISSFKELSLHGEQDLSNSNILKLVLNETSVTIEFIAPVFRKTNKNHLASPHP